MLGFDSQPCVCGGMEMKSRFEIYSVLSCQGVVVDRQCACGKGLISSIWTCARLGSGTGQSQRPGRIKVLTK